MTAFATATLRKLLQLRQPFTLSEERAPQRDAGDTEPMLFRSEGFAEDLFDTHPSH